MNKKLLIISVAALMGTGMANTAFAASVTFTGEIYDTACEVNVNKSGSMIGQVEMGSIELNDLRANIGATTTPVAFSIDLSGCVHGANNYSIEFSGTPFSPSSSDFSAQDFIGSGVAYQIKDSAGNAIAPNALIPVSAQDSDENSSEEMNFTVNLVNKNGVMNAGDFVMPTAINVRYN
ncbi:fimbrial protein [Rahnella aceris]|uniref:fimbrial protein n=1 Tax=Rahnella sp. (strain Y9602) TaxID=2703885 RepID=UPI001C27135B|nr:fimbrial protein [Rahnella aceris]MBU9851470.1 type 1 fimbrial protein [Rahnella aceris]